MVKGTFSVLGVLVFKALMKFACCVTQALNRLLKDFILPSDCHVDAFYCRVQLIIRRSSLHVPVMVRSYKENNYIKIKQIT